MDINIVRYDTVGSTNTEAAEQARRGAKEGLCVIAREQTGGRGRYGRNWVSGRDSGLYMSIVLRPSLDPSWLPLITLMTGIAVYDALADLGMSADIKWVNDLLVGEKKIGGILAEAIATPTGNAVIVGIGVNLRSTNFPPEIAETATSIETETGRVLDANDVAEPITRHLSHYYHVLNKSAGPAEIIKEWSARSTYFKTKMVRVTLSDKVIEGVTAGLEENGALRVKTVDGSVIIVEAGDVERLRAR